jgi:hypothetical protein
MRDENAGKKQKITQEYEVSRDRFYLLKYSGKFHSLARKYGLTTDFFTIDSKHYIKVDGKQEFINHFYFNCINSIPSNKIITIKIDDFLKAHILELELEQDYFKFKPEILGIIVELYSNFAFIKKDQHHFEDCAGQNVLLFEIDASYENKLRTAYRNILEDYQESLRDRSVIFDKSSFVLNDDSAKELKIYLNLGQEISKSDETIKIVELIRSISNSKSPYLDFISKNPEYNYNDNFVMYNNIKTKEFPFIFVCASSGTGKTQLPFSLNIPLLYLINNKRILQTAEDQHQQLIYKNFFNLSRKFIRCVELDRYLIYDKDFSINYSDTFNDCKSMLAGFFVTLFELIYRYRQKNGCQEHWTISQLNALATLESPIEIRAVCIRDAKISILKLFSSAGFFPLVFLDESQKSDDQYFHRDYKTSRKILD